jgi:hypothetical protein
VGIQIDLFFEVRLIVFLILGMGSDLRSDDLVGKLVIDNLKKE